MILKFKVVGGAMGRIDHNTIAADTVGTVYAEFDVDDVWAGMSAIKAIFTRTEGGPSYIALLGNDRKCTVPHEVMASEGYFNVGLIGIGPGNVLVRTTSVLRAVYVAAAAPVDGSPDPTPSELEQIEALISELRDIAQSVRDDADSGVFNGADGQDGRDGADGAPGEKGEKGEKGDPGDPIKTITTAAAFETWVTNYSGGQVDARLILASFDFDFTVNRQIQGETVAVRYEGAVQAGDVWTMTAARYALIFAYTTKGEQGAEGPAGADGLPGAIGADGTGRQIFVGTMEECSQLPPDYPNPCVPTDDLTLERVIAAVQSMSAKRGMALLDGTVAYGAVSVPLTGAYGIDSFTVVKVRIGDDEVLCGVRTDGDDAYIAGCGVTYAGQAVNVMLKCEDGIVVENKSESGGSGTAINAVFGVY